LSVNWWPNSPMYEGFAPRYDPTSGLGLGEEGNGTGNVTMAPKAKKDSPGPGLVVVPALVAVALLRRRPA